MGDPTSSDVHSDAPASSVHTCKRCGRGYGKGYAKCPKCALAKSADWFVCAEGHEFGGGYAKCPTCLSDEVVSKAAGFTYNKPKRSSTLTQFRPDPRLHSHPFVPDVMSPNACADCGMGTGAHSRMVYTPDAFEAEEEEPTPAKKSILQRLADKLRPAEVNPTVELDPDHSYAVVKSREPERYTLGPVYMPDRLDAHGEFADAETLQKATWDFVRTQDRTIYLQHSEQPAGEWVEIMAWPHEVKASLATPGNIKKGREVTFPPGTVYMGVIWEPWAYDMVRSGQLTGYSMGGYARRTEVEIPAEPVAKHGNHDQKTHGNWATGSGGGEIAPTGPPTVSHDNPAVADAVNRLIADVHAIEPQTTQILSDVAARVGGRMEGLEFKFKAPGGILGKIARKTADGGDPVAAAEKITDALRYTMILDEDTYVAGIGRSMEELRKAGYRFSQTDVENNWIPGDAYQGVNTLFSDPRTGRKVELQFHTAASWDVKQNQNHADYEAFRHSTDPVERRTLFNRMRMRSDAIPIPQDVLQDAAGIFVFRPLD